MVFIVSLGFAGLVALISPALSWTYYDQNEWADEYPGCGGSAQSPIALSAIKRHDPALQRLRFYGYDEKYPIQMFENGHSLELDVNLKHPERPYPLISGIYGAQKPDRFQFAQMHIHIGSESSRGSEHSLGGLQYPGELHLVHWNNKYANLSDAITHKDGVAVLGYFFQVSPVDNPGYKPVIKALPLVNGSRDSYSDEEAKQFLGKLPLDNLLPREKDGDYYYYKGSLTTPGCNEVINWQVFTETIPISEKQLASLRSIVSSEGKSLANNYRFIQPLNGRKVLQYRPNLGSYGYPSHKTVDQPRHQPRPTYSSSRLQPPPSYQMEHSYPSAPQMHREKPSNPSIPSIPPPLYRPHQSIHPHVLSSSNGAVAPSSYGAVAPYSYGAVAPSSYGAVAPSSYGALAPSSYGAVAPSSYGAVAPSSYGAVAPSSYEEEALSSGQQEIQEEIESVYEAKPVQPTVIPMYMDKQPDYQDDLYMKPMYQDAENVDQGMYGIAENVYEAELPMYTDSDESMYQAQSGYKTPNAMYEVDPMHPPVKPVYPTLKPVYPTEKPVHLTGKPVYPTVKAMHPTGKVFYPTEKPMYNSKSVYPEQSLYKGEQPMYNAESMYISEQGNYQDGKSMYTSKPPMYMFEQEQYSDGKPMYNSEPPMYSSEPPMYPSEQDQYPDSKPMYKSEPLVYQGQKQQERQENEGQQQQGFEAQQPLVYQAQQQLGYNGQEQPGYSGQQQQSYEGQQQRQYGQTQQRAVQHPASGIPAKMYKVLPKQQMSHNYLQRNNYRTGSRASAY